MSRNFASDFPCVVNDRRDLVEAASLELTLTAEGLRQRLLAVEEEMRQLGDQVALLHVKVDRILTFIEGLAGQLWISVRPEEIAL